MVRTFQMVSKIVCEAPAQIIDRPQESVRYMADVWDQFPEQEQCWIILLNSKLRPLGRQLLTVGTLKQTLVSPREVYRSALIGGAASVILLHNHPSGDPTPSSADQQITRQIVAAAGIVDVDFFDHIIVGSREADPLGRGFFSFRANGLIP